MELLFYSREKEDALIRLSNFDAAAQQFWQGANHQILWGWKRDVGVNARTVFFSGRLEAYQASVSLARHYFHYSSRMPEADFSVLEGFYVTAMAKLKDDGIEATLNVRRKNSLVNVRLELGEPTSDDVDKVSRLHLRRPRRRFGAPEFPPVTSKEDASSAFPADVYVGSGVSYEAGLPTLCDMHECFGVDSERAVGFASGSDDPLPMLLAQEGIDRVRRFCSLHVQALRAEPTEAMRVLAALQRSGVVGRIFTDNVDNMLSKVGADFERVRGSGVFNERHPVKFDKPNLIVVGVAADRRQIVQQARGKGRRVVVVNPVAKVSPNVTHLDYLRATDGFFKTTAREFFLCAGQSLLPSSELFDPLAHTFNERVNAVI